MTETLFNTHIPVVVIVTFVIGLVLIILEVSVNAKGVLAVVGALSFVVGIVLCGIMGVPVIEIAFLLVLASIIIMLILRSEEGKQKLLNKSNNQEHVVCQENIEAISQSQSIDETTDQIVADTNQNTKNEVDDVI